MGRYRYCKNFGVPFFKTSDSTELTSRQLILLRYIEMYDSLYELDEVKRPSEDVIKNDRELDYWMEQYKMEIYNDLVKYYKQMGKNYGGVANHNPRYVIGGDE